MSIFLAVPCYNEQFRLNIEAFADKIKSNTNLNFIFVNDGSTDQTEQIIKNLFSQNPTQIQYLSLAKNRGKAEAVRQGVLWAYQNTQAEFIGFWDADLATPLDDAIVFQKFLTANPEFKAVFGSRILKLGTLVKRKISRHYLGRIFATAVSLLLQEPIYDSQCGAKIFRREVIQTCFSKEFLSRWLFDVEILFRLKTTGDLKQMIFEHPVSQWHDHGKSKVGIKNFFIAPFELICIHFQYKKKLPSDNNTRPRS